MIPAKARWDSAGGNLEEVDFSNPGFPMKQSGMTNGVLTGTSDVSRNSTRECHGLVRPWGKVVIWG